MEEDEQQPQYDDDSDSELDDDSGSETMDVTHWDELFRKNIEDGTNTEYLMSYPTLAPHLGKFLRPGGRVLVVGCGDSDLSHGLYTDGFHDLTSCDISPVVVRHMKEKHPDCPGLNWVVDDATNMQFQEQSFDVVVDKSLLDCLFHVKNFDANILSFLREVKRVLCHTPDSVAVFLTATQPEAVMPYLEWKSGTEWQVVQDELTVEVDDKSRVAVGAVAVGRNDPPLEVPFSKTFYLFVCRPSLAPPPPSSPPFNPFNTFT